MKNGQRQNFGEPVKFAARMKVVGRINFNGNGNNSKRQSLSHLNHLIIGSSKKQNSIGKFEKPDSTYRMLLKRMTKRSTKRNFFSNDNLGT